MSQGCDIQQEHLNLAFFVKSSDGKDSGEKGIFFFRKLVPSTSPSEREKHSDLYMIMARSTMLLYTVMVSSHRQVASQTKGVERGRDILLDTLLNVDLLVLFLSSCFLW